MGGKMEQCPMCYEPQLHVSNRVPYKGVGVILRTWTARPRKSNVQIKNGSVEKTQGSHN